MDHTIDGVRYWLFAKYDLADFDKIFLLRFCRLLTSVRPGEAELDDVGLITNGQLNFTGILKMYRKFTLVYEKDGSLQESHPDFMKKGQTEHAAFVQHQLQFADWSQLEKPARGKRQLRAPKAKSAPKRRRASSKKAAPAVPVGVGVRQQGAVGGIDARDTAIQSNPFDHDEHDLFGSEASGDEQELFDSDAFSLEHDDRGDSDTQSQGADELSPEEVALVRFARSRFFETQEAVFKGLGDDVYCHTPAPPQVM
jgi:hypothetical protein